jgi:transcriptional regulator with XRE-family HTH domain
MEAQQNARANPQPSLGSHLKYKRERSGLSSRAVAEKVGIDHALLLRVESGQRPMRSAEKLVLWARALSIDEARLLERAAKEGGFNVRGATELPTLRALARMY